MHHIITDGWSFGVAAGELSALYEAFRLGRPSPLPEPAIQYADYAGWQRDWLQGERKERLVAYWRRHLEGVRPLELPTDRPRPPVRSSRGDLRQFAVSKELSAALVELGRREGATPFMTLLAAFQILLARTSGQQVFAVGSPIANRNRAEVEGLVGYFINMLAFRADLSGDPTFRDLLARVRETALGGYEHQDLPLEMLVEAIHPERDPSRTPLFQAMFVLQNNQLPDVDPRRPDPRTVRRGGHRHGQVRPLARDGGDARRLRRLDRIRHRPVRWLDDRSDARPVPGPGRDDRCRPRSPHFGARPGDAR